MITTIKLINIFTSYSYPFVCVCVCARVRVCVLRTFTIYYLSRFQAHIIIHNSHHTVKELIHLINESLYPRKHVMATVIIIIINLFINHLLYIKYSVKFLTCFI